MIVGINYPWVNYGWDFGEPVPGWGSRAAWRDSLSRELTTLRSWGVSVVRWFVLADGITMGTGRRAPRRSGGQWRFDRIPVLEPELVSDFTDLLEVFARHEMQLLPVLIDFHWGFPGLDRNTTDEAVLRLWHSSAAGVNRIPEGYVKGGRIDAILDSGKRSFLFHRVLRPLLEASRRYRSTIYAWELINEPEWITRQRGLGGSLEPHRRVPLDQMLAFIREGNQYIARYNFLPTVGFAKPTTPMDWEQRAGQSASGRGRRFRQSNELHIGLNQFHYYPRGRTGRPLPSARFPNGLPGIVGEFATHILNFPPSSDANQKDPGSVWPDLADGQQTLDRRLRLVSTRSYAAAFPWSYRARDGATTKDPGSIERGIRQYLATLEGSPAD